MDKGFASFTPYPDKPSGAGGSPPPRSSRMTLDAFVEKYTEQARIPIYQATAQVADDVRPNVCAAMEKTVYELLVKAWGDLR